MRKVRLLSALLPLVLIIACSDDDSVTPPPQPPALSAEDQLTVANVKTIRDALETYAAAHSGSYGDYWVHWDQLGITHFDNAYSGEFEPSVIQAREAGQIGFQEFACGETVLGYRITGYGRDHMLITLEALANVPADLVTKYDLTVDNAYLVRDAAKSYAAANAGEFPTDINGDTNKDGNTLVDMLPNGMLLNPFEGNNTEPQDGIGLGVPGAIGYLGADSGSGIIDSFNIEAYACNSDIMLSLPPYDTQYGEFIWGGSYLLRFVVETFAKDSGHYPHDLDTETTPGGKTVLDLISEHTGTHLPYFVNYYNQDHYVPELGTPTGNFTIGYQPIEAAGIVTDYVITGRAMFKEIIRLGPRPLD